MSEEYESRIRKIELLEINGKTVFQQNHICIPSKTEINSTTDKPSELELMMEVDEV